MVRAPSTPYTTHHAFVRIIEDKALAGIAKRKVAAVPEDLSNHVPCAEDKVRPSRAVGGYGD